MMPAPTIEVPSRTTAARVRDTWNRLADRLGALVGDGALALVARIAIAAIVLQSGRTKVEGFLPVTKTGLDYFKKNDKLKVYLDTLPNVKLTPTDDPTWDRVKLAVQQNIGLINMFGWFFV